MQDKIIHLADYRSRLSKRHELIILKDRVEKYRLEEIRHFKEAQKKEREDIEYLGFLSKGLDCAIAGQLPFCEIEMLVDVVKSERRFR